MSELFTVQNASASIGSFSSQTSWFGVMGIIGFVVVIISIFIMALSSLERYKKIKGLLGWALNTISYFFVGVGSLLVIALPSLVLYYFGKQAYNGNVAPLRYTFYIVVGYFIIVLVGWISETYVIKRIIKFEKHIKRNKDD